MKILNVVLFCLFFLSTAAFSDEPQKNDSGSKTFSLTAYPIPAYIRWYSFEGELALSRHFSLAIEGKYCSDIDLDLFYDNYSRKKYFEAGPGLRFYPSVALNGFFVGVYADYVHIEKSESDSDRVVSQKGYSVTGWIGYKLILGYTVLEMSAGYGYSSIHKSMEVAGFGLGLGFAI
jgi:hypothetical protein